MRPARPGLVLAVALTLSACGGAEQAPQELETEIVEPPPDAGLSTVGDEKPRPRPEGGVAGVLPGGFPSGLPLYEPSSIVDFGYGDDDRPFVLFYAAAPPGEVVRRLVGELRAAGWSPREADGGRLRAERGGRRVDLLVSATGGGSEIRVAYDR